MDLRRLHGIHLLLTKMTRRHFSSLLPPIKSLLTNNKARLSTVIQPMDLILVTDRQLELTSKLMEALIKATPAIHTQERVEGRTTFQEAARLLQASRMEEHSTA